MRKAFSEYKADVQTKAFPAAEHTVDMSEDEWKCLQEKLTQESPSFFIRDQSVR
jgi:hypothetical protein